MPKTLKIIFLCVFLLSSTARAENLAVKVEHKAAKIDACSATQPCIISVEKRKDKFIVIVKKAALITKQGVIKFKSGNTNHHTFDNNGNWLQVIHTP
ncbi:MAG: hypothetical protein KZQ58_06930 [gamma proteobacterium symbiont of Bathyaustriella thionipta]|nr:hypothetical protein [gamma proteobacterium symbiont of Bathyaustriella thionipta]